MGAVMRRQPQGLVRLARGGLQRGLVDAWVGANPLSLLSNGALQPLSPTSAPPATVGVQGRGVQFDGSAQYLSRTAAAASSLAECTILVVVTPQNVNATTRSIFGYSNSASNNALLFLGQGSTSGQISFFCRSDANTSQNLQIAGGADWVAGVPAVLIGSRSEGSNQHAVYLNGNSLSSTTALALGAVTLNRTTVGGLVRSSPGLLWNGGVFLTAFWNRQLTDTEIRELSQNPWLIFEPPDDDDDIPASGLTISADLSESGSAADTCGAVVIYAAAIAEAASSADQSVAAATLAASSDESGAVADSQTAAATFAAALVESAAGGDATEATAVMAADQVEQGAAAENISSTLTTGAAVPPGRLRAVFHFGHPCDGLFHFRKAFHGRYCARRR